VTYPDPVFDRKPLILKVKIALVPEVGLEPTRF
jgi:hypothetical protein